MTTTIMMMITIIITMITILITITIMTFKGGNRGFFTISTLYSELSLTRTLK